ncbi:unnamed protein product [Medioppia subpectinata]|uniref:F-box domain-containing protein n=1 Tax=Medioppia subpectinata TaxID=1979941 RepID=A0A7R9L1K0_9ACAR|nr:unnamed protein product [Medioppia subpectinata]CAG2113624.1 unnamed protein product [Medioppia subpectinata]
MMASLETTDDGNEDNRQQIQMYAKDSMDRFGDDLCQLLLSYLSFKDRFRYECVSKQFQRTVFESVVDITLSDGFIMNLMSGTLIDTQLLATIARKIANIGSIDCRGINISRLPALKTLFVEFPTDGYNFNCNDLNAVLSSSPKLKNIEFRVNNDNRFYSKAQ